MALTFHVFLMKTKSKTLKDEACEELSLGKRTGRQRISLAFLGSMLSSHSAK